MIPVIIPGMAMIPITLGQLENVKGTERETKPHLVDGESEREPKYFGDYRFASLDSGGTERKIDLDFAAVLPGWT
jgi:hypothetical protein